MNLAIQLLLDEEDRLMDQKSELLAQIRAIDIKLAGIIQEINKLQTWKNGITTDELKTLSKLKAVVRLREGRLSLIDAKKVIETMEWYTKTQFEREQTEDIQND